MTIICCPVCTSQTLIVLSPLQEIRDNFSGKNITEQIGKRCPAKVFIWLKVYKFQSIMTLSQPPEAKSLESFENATDLIHLVCPSKEMIYVRL